MERSQFTKFQLLKVHRYEQSCISERWVSHQSCSFSLSVQRKGIKNSLSKHNSFVREVSDLLVWCISKAFSTAFMLVLLSGKETSLLKW
jgi:hypothetical protein